MPNTHNVHAQAAAGVELRNFGYAKVATVAALPATGRAGEIVTVTATGVDYQWNQVLARWQEIPSRFGSEVTTGTLDFNHATNATHGSGATLLAGSATNAPATGAVFWHTFCFEFAGQAGNGNLTQLAIPYARQADINAGMWMRGRFAGTWSGWRRIDTPACSVAAGGLTGTPSGAFTDSCTIEALPVSGDPEDSFPAAGFPVGWRQLFTGGTTGTETWIVLDSTDGVRQWQQIA